MSSRLTLSGLVAVNPTALVGLSQVSEHIILQLRALDYGLEYAIAGCHISRISNYENLNDPQEVVFSSDVSEGLNIVA